MVAGFNQGVSRVTSSSPSDTPFGTRSLFFASLTNGFYASLPARRSKNFTGYSVDCSNHSPALLTSGQSTSPWHSQGSTCGPPYLNPKVLRVLHMSDTEVPCRKITDACLRHQGDFPRVTRDCHWATDADGCTLPSLGYRDVQIT